MNKAQQYEAVSQRVRALIADERDVIAVMATMACELHHAFEYYDWTGFYRVTAPGVLKIGPYQGGHGCLVIGFDRGVCGRAARMRETQLVDDVTQVPWHIACASSTRAEIVVPVFDTHGEVRAVLDVDSDSLAAFDEVDQRYLEELCSWLVPLDWPE